MKQEPILLKDLMAAITALPDPNKFEFSQVSIPVKDSISKNPLNTREVLFNKWKRVDGESSGYYWVLWHTIAIK